MKIIYLVLASVVAQLFSVNMLSQTGEKQSEDQRRIVAVDNFESSMKSNYTRAVTEKVIELITKSRRFQVFDRTSNASVKSELEFQKDIRFDKQTETKWTNADFSVTGLIRNISVVKIQNGDNFSGYRALVSFTMKIIDIKTLRSTEAQSFESKNPDSQLTAERAVDEAIRTLEPAMERYFQENFPLEVRVAKLLASKDSKAKTILIAGGSSFGLKKGDILIVQKIEMIDGKPYPIEIGEIEVTRVAGENFSECSVEEGETEIFTEINNKANLVCNFKK